MWDPNNTRDLMKLIEDCEKAQKDSDDTADAAAEV